ncbi:MAG: DNA-directed RNA polymerase subunit omega [bacterium]|jgi:DNA-directed RNA polymerase subunit omega
MLNAELIEKAKQKVASVPLLVNIVSRRVRQLNAGMRPYLKPTSQNEEKVDIALREIIEDKLTAEIGFFDSSSPGSATVGQ